MTPPKITRPAVPEVKHEFPAFYMNTILQQPYSMQSAIQGFNMVNGIEVQVGDNIDVRKDPEQWERLPSGTQITFTQP